LADTLRRGYVLPLSPAAANRPVCETWRKRVALAALVVVSLALPARAVAQPAAAHETPAAPAASPAGASHAESAPPAAAPAAPAGEHGARAGDAAAGEHGGSEAHDASPWGFIGKTFNFAVLAGALFYLARKPFAQYLADRSTQIRDDLVRASEMKEEAGRQIAQIDAKLEQLPSELDALRARGQVEVAAEEARIDEAAAQERDRLLEQTRREIGLQLRLARRDLVTHAADLSVQLARERIRERITDEDQARLVDRYIAQVRTND
jgi:F-type H+-transporting ATPase subunit b